MSQEEVKTFSPTWHLTQELKYGLCTFSTDPQFILVYIHSYSTATFETT